MILQNVRHLSAKDTAAHHRRLWIFRSTTVRNSNLKFFGLQVRRSVLIHSWGSMSQLCNSTLDRTKQLLLWDSSGEKRIILRL